MINDPRARESQLPTWAKILFSILFAAFLVGGLFSGYLFYTTVKEVVAYVQIPALPNLPGPAPQPNPRPSEGEVSPQTPQVEEKAEMPSMPTWDRKGRVNILLLGIDQRECEGSPWRTDTMIVVTVDPESKTAGVLSIPRDLWVDIPGFEPGRINTAHFLGDAYNYPGGGPALAKKTVQRNLGVPIHYYVRINFDGFRRIVDALGGITVEVEKPIRDDRYPDEHCGYMSIYIPKGVQHMDGETALQYARSRHGSSDFDRARRQQKVLFAIRDRALSLNLLPKLPQLLKTMGDTVQTDLQPREILALAQIGVQIQPEDIKSAVIDETMTVEWITPKGADVLIPLREKMEPLINELFFAPSPSASE
ncbi:MAG TPA: LytR family transcriptional regulator [Anaerolineae bacterium]|nr:LytR family transcriptional regulator [Anaerolineae bacterium]